jgi:hypothetical protein
MFGVNASTTSCQLAGPRVTGLSHQAMPLRRDDVGRASRKGKKIMFAQSKIFRSRPSFAATLVAAVAMFLFGNTSTASAGNMHFIGPVSAQVVGDEVVITGKIAGLGNGDITYQVDVDCELTIFLVNPGAKGNKPPGQNKEPLHAADAGLLDGSEKNGQFTFVIRVDLSKLVDEAVAATEVKQNWFAEAGPLAVNDISLTITQGNDVLTAP